MKLVFDKNGYVKTIQMNIFAPQLNKLKEGNIGEWIIGFMFLTIFGWAWYLMLFPCFLDIKKG